MTIIDQCSEIIDLFNSAFLCNERTLLAHANGDPEYVAAKSSEEYHTLYFANGFVQSAMHEISHWCIAGIKRRQHDDFGYWYRPDGRTDLEQIEFEKFEAKPQGLEWHLSIAALCSFHISLDNLSNVSSTSSIYGKDFAEKARSWALYYKHVGLPPKAKIFLEKLWEKYSSKESYEEEFAAIAAGKLPQY